MYPVRTLNVETGIDATTKNPYIRVLKDTAAAGYANFPEKPEVVRFMQTGGAGDSLGLTSLERKTLLLKVV